MELKLKSIGSTNGFVTWLKGFKDINGSLLVEIDLESNEFIAKSFPQDKSVVKYAKISFEDAGFELSHIQDNGVDFDWVQHDTETDGRVKVGIYNVLGKFIDVVSMFDGSEHEMVVNFDICNNVLYWGQQKAVKEYQATTTVFHSKSLTMTVKNSQISEFFQKCDDETFLTRVCNIGSPSTYEVNTAVLGNLSKIASVFAADKSRDLIKFYSKEVDGVLGLYAYDETNGSFDYLLGYYATGQQGQTATTIFKENFLNATKGLIAETLEITMDTAGASRILVDAGNSKVVIAAAKSN
jgi:hypothetical protein